MSIFGGAVVFICTWWMVFFCVVPFTVRAAAREEQPEGAMPGAPVKPDFKKILLFTTLIAIVLWGMIFVLAESGIISFQRMSEVLR